MSRIAFVNAELLDPEIPVPSIATLLVEDGRIMGRLDPSQRVPEGFQRVELFGCKLAPGLIDIHHHGVAACANPESFSEALTSDSASLVRHGVTGFLPTALAWAPERLHDYVTRVIDSMTHPGRWRAVPLGLHLEGPWISASAAGGQPLAGVREPTSRELEELWDASQGRLEMVTLAPEVPGCLPLIEKLSKLGVVSALGHSLARPDRIEAAVQAGMTHVTHLFNSMGPLHHRVAGVATQVLADDRLSCDLVADGLRVHPKVLKLAARALGERLVLVSDRLDVRGEGAQGMQGSRLTLDRAVSNICTYAELTPVEAIRAASFEPARILGVEHERGSLRPRARADLVVLDDDGRVLETWVEGRCLYAAETAAEVSAPGFGLPQTPLALAPRS